MFTVRLLPSGKRIKLRGSLSILEAARQAGVQIESACGGKQKCGKCKVIVRDQQGCVSAPNEIEKELLGAELIQKGYRLACAALVSNDATVFVPKESRCSTQVILTSAQELPPPSSLRPPVVQYNVTVPFPTISEPVADHERLLRAMASENGLKRLHADPYVIRKLPDVLRSEGGRISVLVRMGQEIVALGKPQKKGPYGIAVDIGSTTVVSYLVDMGLGKIVCVKSAMNPQIPYGDDVISRISFCQEKENGLERLHRSIVSCINSLIGEACGERGITAEDVIEMAVVGNTAMHHLFVGVNPQFLSVAPYAPAISSAQEYKARDIGIKIAQSGYIYMPPVKAGFVGSDAIACVISTGLYRSRLYSLLIDIGTNGEIVLGDHSRIMCCSTAAGPAFEGGHIKWGMRAASGAIERVNIDPNTLEVRLKTVHDQRPIGICGSGLISAVAELIRTGCILHRGNFNEDLKNPRLREGEDGMEFVLSWKEENPTGHDIVIAQKDVAELQMAKAAIRAGIAVLMDSGGKDIKRIYLAGAGGNFVDPLDAQTIGLLPSPARCDIIACGNAAGHGACLALVDVTRRYEAQRIAAKMEYVELAGSARFQDLFVGHMFFSNAVDSNREF